MSQQNNQHRPRTEKGKSGPQSLEDWQRVGKRTGVYFPRVNPNDRSDGMARWSDYLTQSDESDSLIPLVKVNQTDAFSLIKQQELNASEATSSELPQSSAQVIYIKSSIPEEDNEDKSKSTTSGKVLDNHKRLTTVQSDGSQKESNELAVPEKKMPIPNRKSIRYTEREEKVPFNCAISSIKKRAPSVRPSEKYLLDLLSSKNKESVDEAEQVEYERQLKERQNERRRQQQLRQEERRRQQQQQQRQQRRIQQQQRQQRRREQQRRLQEEKRKQRQSRREQEKRIKVEKMDIVYDQSQQISSRYSRPNAPRLNERYSLRDKDQHRPTLDDKPTKNKRVTINDRGKVKLPTDSFSLQYEPLLPPSLRKGLDSSSKKRPKPTQIKEEQEVIEEQPEIQPMDIVQPPKQDDHEDHNSNREPSPPKVVIQKVNKKKPVRITDPIPSRKDQKSKNKGSSRNRSRRRNNAEEKEKEKPKSKTEGISSGLDRKKKLRKIQNSDNQENTISEQVVPKQQSEPLNIRSVRLRRPPCQYWMPQKPVYKNKLLVISAPISPEEFMDILGFQRPQRIKASIIQLTERSMVYKVDLRPNQTLYSNGLNCEGLKQKVIDYHRYNSLDILCVHSNPDVVVTIDDVQVMKLQKKDYSVTVREGVSFEIKNETSKLMCLNFFLNKDRS